MVREPRSSSRLAGTLFFFVGTACLLACSKSVSGVERGRSESMLAERTVTLTAPAPMSVLAPVVVGSHSVFLGVGSKVTVGGAVVLMGSGGMRAEREALLNDTWSRSAIELRDRVRVRGVLHAADRRLGDGVTVDGYDSNPVFDPVSSLDWNVAFPSAPTISDVAVRPDETATLAPGRHGTVHLFSRATLNLSTGTYYVSDLRVEPQATVRLEQQSGPIILYAGGELVLRGRFASATGEAPDLLLGYLGERSVVVESLFDGALVAPFTSLTLRAVSGAHAGFFAAQDVELDADAEVRYRPPLAVIAASHPPPHICRKLIPHRPDLTGVEREEAHKKDFERYCRPCRSVDDTDRDGVRDCFDECPYDPLKVQRGICGCGAPDTDTDGDGAPDCIDECRNDPNNVARGQCGCAGDPRRPPAGTPCTDTACPQPGATCNGQGVCGNRSICNPGGPGNCRWVSWQGTTYWLCGMGVPPSGLPPRDAGADADAGDGGFPTEDPPRDAGTGPLDTGPPPTGGLPRNGAAASCSARGLTLTRIDSLPENQFLTRFLTAPIWLGANDLSIENQWRWAAPGTNDGDAFWSGGPSPSGFRVANRFAYWSSDAPGPQDCAIMQPGDGRWFHSSCTSVRGYICKYVAPIVPLPPDAGPSSDPPGMPGQPPPAQTPCIPEGDSGLPLTLGELALQIALAEDAGIFVGAAANPPPPNSVCPDDPEANAIGLQPPLAGCAFTNVVANSQCITNADCATWGAGYSCRQVKEDPLCTPPDAGMADAPAPGNTCPGFSRCGILVCPAADPARCGQVEVCHPNSQFDAGIDPGSNVDAEPFAPASLFVGGVPDAAPSAAYFDPPLGAGANHSWCRLTPQDPGAVQPAAQASKNKRGSSGGGASIGFEFDPDLIFEVNPNPLPFGESEMTMRAQAKFVATARLNNFLGQSYSAPIIDVVAGVSAERCGLHNQETHFQVFGLDFIDPANIPRVDTDDPSLSPVAYRQAQACRAALADFKLYGDRAKKAFRDAQQLLAQYHAARAMGGRLPDDLCQQIGVAAASIPFFPGGSSCGLNEPVELTIDRLIQFYQEPGGGELSRLRSAASSLFGATAALNNVIARDLRLDFVNATEEQSHTIVSVPFAIGPIPMLLQIDVFAQYGIAGRLDLELAFPTHLDAPLGDPQRLAHARVAVLPRASAGLSAFVGAGVDLGAFRANVGLEGAVTLANAQAPIFAGAGIDVAAESDVRLLPADIRPPVALATNAFQFGLPKSFRYFVTYDYGAAIDLRDVLTGEISARLRIKFLFFSRTWRKRVVRFNGWSFHFNLVSESSHPDVTTVSRTVSGSADPERGTTPVAEGRTQMGRAEAQVPFVELALLPPPSPDGGVGPEAGPVVPLSTAAVSEFFYDNLCCADLGQACRAAGSPACCPPNTCVGADAGLSGTCQFLCRRPGESCTTDLDCCPTDDTYCGANGTCIL